MTEEATQITQDTQEDARQTDDLDPALALKSARNEAAKLRTRAKTAETERDQLAAELEATRAKLDAARRDILASTAPPGQLGDSYVRYEENPLNSRIVAEARKDVLASIDADQMFDEDGHADWHKFTSAIQDYVKKHPYVSAWFKPAKDTRAGAKIKGRDALNKALEHK